MNSDTTAFRREVMQYVRRGFDVQEIARMTLVSATVIERIVREETAKQQAKKRTR